MANTVVPDGRGRLLLPAKAREALGLGPRPDGRRQEVAVETRRDGSVVLRPWDPAKVRADAIKGLRGAMRSEGGSVDDLLAERRREVGLEAEKEQRLAGRP